MGVETELLGIKNRYDGKEFRVIEREDGTIAVLAGDKVLVDSGVVPVTAIPSESGVTVSVPGGRQLPAPAFSNLPAGIPRVLAFGNSIARQSAKYLFSFTTTINGDSAGGSATFNVASGAGLAANDKIAVQLYNGRMLNTTVGSVAGNVVTPSAALPALFRNGDGVAKYTTPAGGALTQSYGSANAAAALLGGAVEVVPAYGYVGALCQAILPDLPRELRHYRPHVVVLHLFENNMTNTTTGTLGEMKAWAQSAARMCLDYGAVPVVCSPMPGSTYPTGRNADFDALLAYLCKDVVDGKSQLEIDVPGACGFDYSTPWLDTSASNRAPLGGWTDGIHPSIDKRFAVGAYLAPTLQSLLPTLGTWSDAGPLTPAGLTQGAGIGGTLVNMQAGSVAPDGYTITANGTAVATSAKTADGTLKISASWPAASNNVSDMVLAAYTFTAPASWTGGTQRLKAFFRFRINSKTSISGIYHKVVTASGGDQYLSNFGTGMSRNVPAGGQIVSMTTPEFRMAAGQTTATLTIYISPETLASPSGAAIDIDVLELGLIGANSEPPVDYI